MISIRPDAGGQEGPPPSGCSAAPNQTPLVLVFFQESGVLRDEQNEELQAPFFAVRAQNRDDRGERVHRADQPAQHPAQRG